MVYGVPLAPLICVEVGAAGGVAGDIAGADDVIADDEDDVAELEDWLELFDWWHPAPIRANTAIATENDAVLLLIARMFSSRIPLNRTGLAPVDGPKFRL